MSVSLITGKGGLPAVRVANDAATAEIMLLGAHLISYVPAHSTELIWMSSASQFKDGTPIRGGIPICWPWFAKHAQDPDNMPMHGFARHTSWGVTNVSEPDSRHTTVTLTLSDTPASRRLWPHPFRLDAIFTIADTLTVELVTLNLDDQPVVVSQGIHTYFQLKDIEAIRIHGFDNVTYFDKARGANDIKTMPAGPFAIREEVDGVFKHAPGPFVVDDPELNRTITVTTAGSDSAVIWNPWKERSAVLPDYTPDAYKTMVCVETCNALEDARTIQPGQSHAIKATYTVAQR